MNKFKVGDKVKCIIADDCLSNSARIHNIKDEILTIETIWYNEDILVKNVQGIKFNMTLKDVELVEEKQNKKTFTSSAKIIEQPLTPEQTEKLKEMILSSLAPIFAENIAYKTMCEQLKKDLDDLEKQLKKDKKPTPLDTYHGDGWAVSPDLSFTLPSKQKVDKAVFNIFRTKESAEQARKHLQITCALLNFREENDKNVNLDGVERFYYITQDLRNNSYMIDLNTFYKDLGVIAFSSRELAQSALDMLKRKGVV